MKINCAVVTRIGFSCWLLLCCHFSSSSQQLHPFSDPETSVRLRATERGPSDRVLECDFIGPSANRDPANVPWTPKIAFSRDDLELGSYRYDSHQNQMAVYWHTTALVAGLNLYTGMNPMASYIFIYSIRVQNTTAQALDGLWSCSVEWKEQQGYGRAIYLSNYLQLN